MLSFKMKTLMVHPPPLHNNVRVHMPVCRVHVFTARQKLSVRHHYLHLDLSPGGFPCCLPTLAFVFPRRDMSVCEWLLRGKRCSLFMHACSLNPLQQGEKRVEADADGPHTVLFVITLSKRPEDLMTARTHLTKVRCFLCVDSCTQSGNYYNAPLIGIYFVDGAARREARVH